MFSTLFSIAALIAAVSCHYYPTAWSPIRQLQPTSWNQFREVKPISWNQLPEAKPQQWNEIRDVNPVPQCVLGNQLKYIPMYVIPERQISIVQDYRTRYFTPAPALVNFIGQESPLPAVRVVLSNPIPVTSWKSFIEFPTTFTILQDGYRLPFPVTALYAPLPERDIFRRPVIDVVYAVPAAPITPAVATTTTTPAPTTSNTVPPRNVTVLHFPEALAEPQVIYQEIDDELGGRNPPIPVVPAGIVQSSAPTADVTLFVNSKESPILQLLRDEAEANRRKNYYRTY